MEVLRHVQDSSGFLGFSRAAIGHGEVGARGFLLGIDGAGPFQLNDGVIESLLVQIDFAQSYQRALRGWALLDRRDGP